MTGTTAVIAHRQARCRRGRAARRGADAHRSLPQRCRSCARIGLDRVRLRPIGAPSNRATSLRHRGRCREPSFCRPVFGMEVDFQLPPDRRDRHIEPCPPIARQRDRMLANEAVNASTGECPEDLELTVGLRRGPWVTRCEYPEKLADPGAARRVDPLGRSTQRALGAVTHIQDVLDDRLQRRHVDVSREVDDGAGRGGDADAVGTKHQLVVGQQCRAVGTNPGFAARMAARRGDHVDEPVSGRTAQSPDPPGGRSGDDQIRPAGAQRGAPCHLVDLDAPQPIGPVDDSHQQARVDESIALVDRHVGRRQHIRRDRRMVLTQPRQRNAVEGGHAPERTRGVSHRPVLLPAMSDDGPDDCHRSSRGHRSLVSHAGDRARSDRQPRQAAGVRVPVGRDLRRVPQHVRLRAARLAAAAQRAQRLDPGDGPGA